MTAGPLIVQSDKTVLLAYNASDASIAELFDVGRRKKEPERYGVWLDGFGSWGDQGADAGEPAACARAGPGLHAPVDYHTVP